MRLIGFAGALALLTSPLAAQPQDAPAKPRTEAEVAAAMADILKVEPLTAEQRARLPQAEALILQIMPPGAMDQMMGGMYDKLLGPLMAMATSPSSAQVARELGIDDEDFELSDEEAAQAATILDPVWKERGEREMKAIQAATSKMMRAIEPPMRRGMAEAYAVAFTAGEMTDIAAFFRTPSGASYARKSYALVSDPRIMAASFEAMPALMGEMKGIETEVASATADLPAKRRYDDLSPADRTKLAALTKRGQGALREGMARVDTERAERELEETQD